MVQYWQSETDNKMASEKAYRELASSLARGDATVSRYFIVQGTEFERYLNELPAKSLLL